MTTGAASVRVAARGICKAFAEPVLKNVDLDVLAGTIHGLVGENGAGKSTLVRILVGLTSADAGALLLDGRPYQPADAADSLTAGVAICAQELSLIDDLTIAENILLHTATSGWAHIRRRRAEEKASELLGIVGLERMPGTRVDKLSLAEKQLVEIAKALATDANLLILDEPTSALTEPQADRVHAILRRKAADGVAVIYISHRLRDVLTLCDQVSVLRDGEVRFTRPAHALHEQALIREMAGADADFEAAGQPEEGASAIQLSVENLRTRSLPHPISFNCRRGEILGIAGLAGSGRTELLHAVFGLDKRLAGSVKLRTNGVETDIRSTRHAIRCGIGLVAEDRSRDGVFGDQALAFNVTVAGLRRIATRLGRLIRSRETSVVLKLIRELRVSKTNGVDQRTRELSGGNQQKLMLARWLHCESRLLLLDEPTRGVDVAAKLAIHEELVRLREAGTSVVVVSSEVEELQSLCDRILVLSDRTLVDEFHRRDWSQERILAAAFSQYVAGSEYVADSGYVADKAHPPARAQ